MYKLNINNFTISNADKYVRVVRNDSDNIVPVYNSNGEQIPVGQLFTDNNGDFTGYVEHTGAYDIIVGGNKFYATAGVTAGDLPIITGADEGKVITVSNGQAMWQEPYHIVTEPPAAGSVGFYVILAE